MKFKISLLILLLISTICYAEINASDRKTYLNNHYLVYTLEGSPEVFFSYSRDNGKTFSKPLIITITDEALAMPKLSIDDFSNLHLTFVGKDHDQELNYLYYTKIDPINPQVLFESYDEIISHSTEISNEALIVYCQSEYFKRKQNNLRVSLDNGENFNSAKSFELNQPLPPPIPPQIEVDSDLNIGLKAPEDRQIINRIELSQDSAFSASNTFTFEQLVSNATTESVTYKPAIDLSDGNYFVRATAFDGINYSLPSPTISFMIDHTPPQLTSFEANRKGTTIEFKGTVSEYPIALNINDYLIDLEQISTFEAVLSLQPGNNLFSIGLTDKTGNFTSTSYEVFYNAASPEVIVLKPECQEWFRTDASIIFEAAITDEQNDLDENSEIILILNNQEVDHNLSYDEEDKIIFGFITLPEDIFQSSLRGEITIKDLADNTGSQNFSINIDSQPPTINHSLNKPCYSNSLFSASLEVFDAGAGLDLSSTLVRVAGISLEGTATIEGGYLIINPKQLLSEGTYAIEVIPRDVIGNVGESTTFSLIVDTTTPMLTLTSSYETRTDKNRLNLKGELDDSFPNLVKIYNNGKLIEEITLVDNKFNYNLFLVSGNNDILIVGYDMAGNNSSVSLNVNSSAVSANTLISSCLNGPNPFTSSDDYIYFKYALSQSADIKLYVFDLTGNLIWAKAVSNTSSGTISWNVIDVYGKSLDNGVYPYLLYATAGTDNEISRGKIAVFK